MTTRTDIHRPAELAPENYQEAGWYDLGNSEEFPNMRGLSPAALASDEVWGGPYADKLNRCDHCGARMRYGAELIHTPTGAHIHVGETCLANRFSANSKAQFQSMRKAARLAREGFKGQTAVKRFLSANPRLRVVYRSPVTNEFISDVMAKFGRYGELSERQVVAVLRAWKRERFGYLRPAPVKVPAPEGKVTVSGRIFKSKEIESPYGRSYKLMVKDERGFVVYVTCPKSLYTWVWDSGFEPWEQNDTVRQGRFLNLVDGVLIRFTADLKQSDRDESFAFAKRPTKVEFSDIENAA